MNLKTMMYTTGAAMALFGTTAVTTITANAAVSPTQQTQQTKSNDAHKANGSQANKSQTTQATATAKSADTSKSKTTSTPAKDNNAAAKAQTTTNNNANQNKNATNTPGTQSINAVTTDSNKTASTKFDQKAPRLTGSTYKSENAGFKISVKNTHANKDVTVKYSINTYESDGSASSKPFQIKIYKDGSLYKTIDASSGTATGSFSAPKGTYTLQVLTSQSTHYTGGLSVQ
ncbi:hypothetical protein [Lentilactobacillus otakiensis]|uniref:hypothetical protein n=1 Tax=Lentilactobacillus otakiensis TaxID=481720 RepID=UPI003D17BE0A